MWHLKLRRYRVTVEEKGIDSYYIYVRAHSRLHALQEAHARVKKAGDKAKAVHAVEVE